MAEQEPPKVRVEWGEVIAFRVPPGVKALFKSAAAARGETLAMFCRRAGIERMDKEEQ